MEQEPSFEKERRTREHEASVESSVERRQEVESGLARHHETEPPPLAESDSLATTSAASKLQQDLQRNYTDHLKSLESTSLEMIQGVVKSAQRGFNVSLVLNVCTFILGLAIIVVGMVVLFRSPEALGRIIGVVSSLVGLVLVISLLFWRGPLERILGSVSNLAQINTISLGFVHRLNQISRVFVNRSLTGEMDVQTLIQLSDLVEKAVRESVNNLSGVLPRESAEQQVQKLLDKSRVFSRRK